MSAIVAAAAASTTAIYVHKRQENPDSQSNANAVCGVILIFILLALIFCLYKAAK